MKHSLLLLFLLITLYADSIQVYYNSPINKKLESNSSTPISKALLVEINKAKHSIDFAIYGLRNQTEILNALIKAKKRGVRIRGIVDKDTKNNNYYSSTNLLYNYFDIHDDYKKSASYIMHNKFFIFDKQRIFTGSTNISDSGTGGYNANVSTVIEQSSIAKAYTNEFNQMYQGAFHRKKVNLLASNTFSINGSKVNLYFMPNSPKINESIVPLINQARSTINVAIFYLTHKGFTQALINAHKRGVKINIILDASAARNRYVTHKQLRSKGIALKVENWGGKMHMKSLCIDRSILGVGSMNFTKAGEEKNDENMLIIHNATLARQYDTNFKKLWRSIDKRWLVHNPSPEGWQSPGSCSDGVDNDYNHHTDGDDYHCE